jgi:hypothetical protein
MADRQIDPARLQGEALRQWYLRSPEDLEREREAADAQRYEDFFGGGSMTSAHGAFLDRGLADANDGGQLLEIGNRHNSRLKKEHIQKYGFWPQTEDGRDYDVAHHRAIADGGTNTLDNVRPLHPQAHTAEHMANDDFGRWGRRPWIARAFGGTVARALGPLGFVSDITGLLSGRIRTDSFDNFSSDMIGRPSQDDQRKAFERQQRLVNPKWKPGDPIEV